MADADLTADQRSAAAAFSAWLEQPGDGRPFVLSGYAGTGKTFFSMRLLAAVEAAELCWTVVAPTHKAVGVLRSHLALAQLVPTWYPSTIHRLLRLKLRRQGDRECCEETAQTAGALEHLGLVLVDEASMVDSQLLEITLRCAHPFRTRLVFVGDPAQLPPIGEASSPVFALERAERRELTEVVRHQGPVLRLAAGIRQQVLPCRQPPALPPVRSAEGMVALLDRQAWLLAAQEALRRSAETDNPDLVRILCYTNRSLEQLVPIARRALHGAMADQLPVLPGEVLISRSAVMLPACRDGQEAGEEPDMVLGSNRELVVIDVEPERCDLADFGVTASDLAGDPLSGDSRHGAMAVPVIDTLCATVQTSDSQLQLRLLPPIGSPGRIALEAALERLRAAARTAGKAEGKTANKAANKVANRIANKAESRALWRRFFLVRDAFASLGPAAVLSVHRSQGSTFGEVFVASDVFWPRDPLLCRQLVYVAVTRASQAVTLMAGSGSHADQQLWARWLQDDPRIEGPRAGDSGEF